MFSESRSHGFQDINEALIAAQPGDTVLVHKGTYPGPIIFHKRGEYDKPITLSVFQRDRVVITGAKFAEELENSGKDKLSAALLDIKGDYLRVHSFELSNFRLQKRDYQPFGIHINAGSSYIQIWDCEIHDVGSDAQVDEKADGRDAHGILVEGSKSKKTHHIELSKNYLHDLVLGSSEALVLNGNVESFWVESNVIEDCDNIGIDCIGYENTPSRSCDRARHGWIENNTIRRVSSFHNPSYLRSRSAAGIYIDGGQAIVVRNNRVSACDYGIEVASERRGRYASQIGVFDNVLYGNFLAGITIGGSSSSNGGTLWCRIRNNKIIDNDRAPLCDEDYSGQLQIQNNVKRVTVESNLFRRYRPDDFPFINHYVDGRLDLAFRNNTYLGSRESERAWKLRDRAYNWDSYTQLRETSGERRKESDGPISPSGEL